TDARNPFLLGEGQKQEIGLGEFGATVGGPLKQDKAFFFFAYEGQRYHVGNPTAFSYPSMDPRALPIAGTTTSVISACNTVRAAGTPLSPTSLKVAGLDANCNRTSGYSIFDLPNVFARGVDANGAASANISGSLNTEYNVDGGLAKIDLHPSEKHTVNGNYYIGTHRGLVVNNQTITQPFWRPNDNAWVHFFGLQWDYAKSSSVVNTARFGYNRFYQFFETSDCPGSGSAPDYGVPFGYGTTKPVCGFTNISLSPFSGSIGCCPIFLGDPRRHVSGKAMAGFFQDDWRITSKLILNLGLRYEFTTPIKEAKNQFANFDVDRGLLQLGKNTDRMWNPDKNNFAPRIGFAYDLTGSGRTVIRGGANVIYVTPGWWIFLSQ